MKPKFTAIRPSELVILAIHNLGGKSGSSEEEIIKFVTRKYALDEQVVTPQIEDALQRCLNFGIISFKNGRYGLEEVPQLPLEESGRDSRKRTKRKRDGDKENNIADAIEREIREWKRKKGMTQTTGKNSVFLLKSENNDTKAYQSKAGIFPGQILKTTKRPKPNRSRSVKKASRQPRQPRKSVKKKTKAKQSTRSRGRPPKKSQSKPGLFARAFGFRRKAKPAPVKRKPGSRQETCSKICPKTCPNSVEKGRMQKWKESQKIGSSNNNKHNSKILSGKIDSIKSKPNINPCENLGL